IVVPLQSRRRQRAAFAQKLQHAVAGVFLLFQGLNTLGHGPEGAELAIAVIEVVTSGLLVVALIRAVRQMRRGGGADGHAHHGIDWVDVLIAGVLAAEALEHWHTTHHLPRPTIVLALSLLVIGLLHGRIAAAGGRRRALRVGPSGLIIPRRRFFGREAFSWSQTARITIGDREAVIETRTGPRRIDLADLDNANQVVAALHDAQRRLGAAPPPPPPVLSHVEAPVLSHADAPAAQPPSGPASPIA
ncbi:MAG: hypothetical protein ABI211_14055, partial [Vicinamibacterales bacterium]